MKFKTNLKHIILAQKSSAVKLSSYLQALLISAIVTLLVGSLK